MELNVTARDESRVHPRQIGAELRRLRQEGDLRHHVTLATICRAAAATQRDVVLAFWFPARTSA